MRHPLHWSWPSVGCGLVFCAFLLAMFTRCQPAAAQGTPRILLGEETDDYEAVGIVGSLSRGGFCTGTLITDSHVLTAAHCAEVIEGPTRGTFELFGRVHETVDVIIHPNYNPRTLANDLAILQLAQPVTDVLPSPIFRGEPLVGDLLLIVGFGATGTATGGSDGSFGTKRVGVTTIDEVTDTLIAWTFDDENEANTAAGDSGGPGYIDIDGDLFLASITSGGTEPDSILGDYAFNTRVDAFAGWIDSTISLSTQPDEDPPVDQPTDDGESPGNPCDSFWSGIFGVSDLAPFPILQILIDLFTTVLDWLQGINDQVDDAADETVVEADETVVEEEPVTRRQPVRRTGRQSSSFRRSAWERPAGRSAASSTPRSGFRGVPTRSVGTRGRGR